jgi:Arc/MetJ-type ribon-helix-helix transcriptional regulator
MIVTLRPEAEALLQEELSTGRFRDASEAIQAALLALREYALEPFTDLDAHLQESFDDIAAGRLYTEEEARAYIALVRAKLDEPAVSRLKCNVFEVVVPVCHEVEVGQEDFCWALPTE